MSLRYLAKVISSNFGKSKLTILCKKCCENLGNTEMMFSDEDEALIKN